MVITPLVILAYTFGKWREGIHEMMAPSLKTAALAVQKEFPKISSGIIAAVSCKEIE